MPLQTMNCIVHRGQLCLVCFLITLEMVRQRDSWSITDVVGVIRDGYVMDVNDRHTSVRGWLHSLNRTECQCLTNYSWTTFI